MPSFNFTRSIPNPPNNPSADVPNMQTNNNSLADIINVDHFSFNQSPSGKDGTHRQVTLTNEAAPGVGAGNGVLYSFLSASPIGDNQSWPAWQNATSALAFMSRAPSPIANGYASLPANILLQWGSAAVNSSGTLTTISFPLTFPTNCFSVTFACVQSTAVVNPSANNVYLTNIALNQFTVSNSSSGTLVKIFWMAVGN